MADYGAGCLSKFGVGPAGVIVWMNAVDRGFGSEDRLLRGPDRQRSMRPVYCTACCQA